MELPIGFFEICIEEGCGRRTKAGRPLCYIHWAAHRRLELEEKRLNAPALAEAKRVRQAARMAAVHRKTARDRELFERLERVEEMVRELRGMVQELRVGLLP